ncbi:hypothetical protein Ga0080574_TMP4649 [Salipiger abyssi]|uniref:Uncharacterized protein n=1 Tax=Salipiger abyssi TaxID=1250539 RepID=A0A1P8V010_9RHOB|nr:hypothetical protein Ga0080574_TMP4649 [Salipiger abyssi]
MVPLTWRRRAKPRQRPITGRQAFADTAKNPQIRRSSATAK